MDKYEKIKSEILEKIQARKSFIKIEWKKMESFPENKEQTDEEIEKTVKILGSIDTAKNQIVGLYLGLEQVMDAFQVGLEEKIIVHKMINGD